MRHLKVFMCIALAVLACSCKQGSKSGQAKPAALPPAGSIVYVRLDTLVNQYDMFNDMKSDLEAKVQDIQNDLQSKGRDFQSDASDFQTKINKGLLTRAQAEEQNRVLSNRQADLQNLSQQKQAEIQQQESDMYNNILDNVKAYLKKYNESKKFALILTTSGATNTVLAGDESLDITNDVLDGLNNEYVKNKKKDKGSEDVKSADSKK